MTTIETDNLRIIPHLPEHILALLRSDVDYETVFGMRIADGLSGFMRSADLSPEYLASLHAPHDPWMHDFAAALRSEDLVVGMCGYKGLPDADGIVEIGYGFAPAYQNRGYATEAARALVNHAFEGNDVTAVIAHTLPETNASGRVLTKCGFDFVGEVIDPHDGPVWQWKCPGKGNSRNRT